MLHIWSQLKPVTPSDPIIGTEQRPITLITQATRKTTKPQGWAGGVQKIDHKVRPIISNSAGQVTPAVVKDFNKPTAHARY